MTIVSSVGLLQPGFMAGLAKPGKPRTSLLQYSPGRRRAAEPRGTKRIAAAGLDCFSFSYGATNSPCSKRVVVVAVYVISNQRNRLHPLGGPPGFWFSLPRLDPPCCGQRSPAAGLAADPDTAVRPQPGNQDFTRLGIPRCHRSYSGPTGPGSLALYQRTGSQTGSRQAARQEIDLQIDRDFKMRLWVGGVVLMGWWS